MYCKSITLAHGVFIFFIYLVSLLHHFTVHDPVIDHVIILTTSHILRYEFLLCLTFAMSNVFPNKFTFIVSDKIKVTGYRLMRIVCVCVCFGGERGQRLVHVGVN